MVVSGQSLTILFPVVSSTGALTAADSTPTCTMYVNGTADAGSVTVTAPATGRYKAVMTVPTLAAGDVFEVWASVTVSTVAGGGLIYRGMGDTGYPLQPTTAGRKLDVSAGGEAGVDWANVGSPSTSVSLSGTTVATVTTTGTATNVTTVNGLASGVITAASIAAGAGAKIADIVLRRTTANVEVSSDGDTLGGRSLYGAVARLAHKVSTSAGTMTVTKSDDTTALTTAVLTTDASADPVTTVDPAA